MDDAFDYVIVGGGTAGAIVAARLSEDPEVSVALLEWGPSDEHEDRALQLQRYPEMLSSEYDLDYPIVEQPRGNSALTLHRGRILGGSSSMNNMALLPMLPADAEAWAALGVTGWDYETVAPYRERLKIGATRPASEDRNACIDAALAAASEGLGIPVLDAWPMESIEAGAGYLDVGYDPDSGLRSSSSVAYLHGIVGRRENLRVITESRALAIELEDGRAVGVRTRGRNGSELTLGAAREVVLSCGAVDTPRLMLLSGIGPAAQLESVGISPRIDLPGVGENLCDHVEGLLVLELNRSPDGGWPSVLDDVAFIAPVDGDGMSPVMAHIFRYAPEDAYGSGTTYGYDPPRHSLSITPNVTRPKSRGSVRLRTSDPDAPPVIDFGYFTDPDGHDERVAVAGVRLAREVAATEPFASWVERELFPGPELQSDAELSERIRAAHGSVCHAAGTCRMGSADDPLAALDSRLRVRDLDALRVVDASAFPTLTTLNPMVTVMMLAEHAATMIKEDR